MTVWTDIGELLFFHIRVKAIEHWLRKTNQYVREDRCISFNIYDYYYIIIS